MNTRADCIQWPDRLGGTIFEPFYKNLALWLVVTLMVVMLYNLFNQHQLSDSSLSYSELYRWLNPSGSARW